jgi:hypothetical protein
MSDKSVLEKGSLDFFDSALMALYWMMNGEPLVAWDGTVEGVEADVLNRVGRHISDNSRWLRQRLLSEMQVKVFPHYSKCVKTDANGSYNISMKWSSVRINAQDLRAEYGFGEAIAINGKICRIEHIWGTGSYNPLPVDGHPTTLWVSGYEAIIPSGSRVESGPIVESAMVYIPPFTIPSGSLISGSPCYPSQDLNLGGFWMDAFEASMPNASLWSSPALSNIAVPASQQGVPPWCNVSYDAALQTAARRNINGRFGHLMNGYEWATILWLNLIFGADQKGSNYYGRDFGDAAVPDSYGIPDPTYGSNLGLEFSGGSYRMNRLLTGSGPNRWMHNNRIPGVSDFFGNVRELLDLTISSSLLTVYRHGRFVAPASAGGTAVSVRIDYIDGLQDTGSITLTNAAGATENVAFSDTENLGSKVFRFTTPPLTLNYAAGDFALIAETFLCMPSGSRGLLYQDDMHEPVDGDVIRVNNVISNRPAGQEFLTGDILQIGNEEMLVTAPSGTGGGTWLLYVERAYNGTTGTTHAIGTPVVAICPQMTNHPLTSPPYVGGTIASFMTDVFLQGLLIPTMASSTEKDIFIAPAGSRVAIRGIKWSDGAGRSPYYLSFTKGFADAPGLDVGFRVCIDEVMPNA